MKKPKRPIVLPIYNVRDLQDTLNAKTIFEAVEILQFIGIRVLKGKKRYQYFVKWSDFELIANEEIDNYEANSSLAKKILDR